MQKLYSLALVLFTLASLHAQSFSIKVDGINRTYLLHVPPNHNANTPSALVFNFHGYTSNANQQQYYAQMDVVADTAGFLVVYPEGINNAWNSFFPTSTTPNDVAFTSAIIDDINRRYKIDATRVYACGMSNGGFMSYRLACELDDRIAAIASVTGLHAPTMMLQCNNGRTIPVLQIHGTDDSTVPYDGGLGIGSVDSTIQFWLAGNNCPNNAVIDTLPNINNTDGSYPIRYRYTGCDGSTEVQLIKIVNGTHTWPGSPVNFPGWVTNLDIDASQTVWNFFASYTHPNPTPLDTTAVNIKQIEYDKLVNAYPNPMGNTLNVQVLDSRVNHVALYDVLGTKIYEMTVSTLPATVQFSTAQLVSGVYFLRVETAKGNITYKLMK